MSLLTLTDVHSYYGHIHALKGISMTVEPGEIVTLIGSNGAGKSTTLRTISGMMHPSRGQIALTAGRYPGWSRTPLFVPGWAMCPRAAAFFPS